MLATDKDRRLLELEDQPGMTKVKRPRLVSLVRDGGIDLARVRPPSGTAF